MSVFVLPHPNPLPKERAFMLAASFENTRDWIGTEVVRQPENVNAEILSPGERTQVKAVVQH